MKSIGSRILVFCLCVFHPFFDGIGQEPGPKELIAARENFEREFVSEIGTIQRKYCNALRQHQRQFTSKGDLESAAEASLELRRANEWETVPAQLGKRNLQAPDLSRLSMGYESAVTKVLDEVIARYAENLEYLKKGFISRNQLPSSLLVEAEIKRIQSKQGLPRNAGAKAYLATLDKVAFKDWLTRQEFQFAGTIAGVTKVTFEAENASYQPSDLEFPKLLGYEIKGNRGVDISNGYFYMSFSNDLQSATFRSKKGEYPVIINPEARAPE